MYQNWRRSANRNGLTLSCILIAALAASACHSLSSSPTPAVQITSGADPAGNCRVSGTVTTDGNVLPGATVTLLSSGSTRTAVTDANGRFVFSSISAGEYTVPPRTPFALPRRWRSGECSCAARSIDLQQAI